MLRPRRGERRGKMYIRAAPYYYYSFLLRTVARAGNSRCMERRAERKNVCARARLFVAAAVLFCFFPFSLFYTNKTYNKHEMPYKCFYLCFVLLFSSAFPPRPSYFLRFTRRFSFFTVPFFLLTVFLSFHFSTL